MTNPTMWPPEGVPLEETANYQIVFLDLSTFLWTNNEDPNDAARRLCIGRVCPNPVNIFSGSHILFVLGYSETPPAGEDVGITGLRFMVNGSVVSANPFEHGGTGQFLLERDGVDNKAKWIWVFDKHKETSVVETEYEYYLMLRRSQNGGDPVAYTLDPKIKNEPGGSA